MGSFDLSLAPAFLAATFVLALVPGPDMVLITATGLSQGRVAGVMTALGVALAGLIHTCGVALGISALIATSPLALDVIRFGGALYLARLAIGCFRSKGLLSKAKDLAPVSMIQVLRRGLLTNLFNPKAILFFMVFLPQFVAPPNGPVAVQLLVLGAAVSGIVLIFNTGVAVASGKVGRVLMRNPVFSRVMDYLLGFVFVALAVRLVSQRQTT